MSTKKILLSVFIPVALFGALGIYFFVHQQRAIAAAYAKLRHQDSIREIFSEIDKRRERTQEHLDSVLNSTRRPIDPSLLVILDIDSFPRPFLSGSQFSANDKGNGWEELKNNQCKIKITSETRDDFYLMNFEITENHLGTDLPRLGMWFFHLQMDLAILNTYSYNSPLNFKKLMEVVAHEEKKYNPDQYHQPQMQIGSIPFRGGELFMTQMSTNGHFTTLQFSISFSRPKQILRRH